MAGLCWMAVVLAFFLSAGQSSAAVDQNWLTSIIEGMKNEYDLGDTFSLAVNVPQDQDINNLQQVFQDDPADTVKQTVSEGKVYQGTRVVAAADSKALSRVLDNIQPLVKSSQGNFLVIYSEESPSANEDSITGNINTVTQNWKGYAFVFSKVVDVPNVDKSQLAESFKHLGIAKLGLDNIFRCYKPGDDPFQCTSCSSGGDVTPSCVASDAPSNQEQGVGEGQSTVPPTGTDTDTDTDTETGKEIAPGEGTAEGEGAAEGEGMGAGIVPEISLGMGGGTEVSGGKGKARQVNRCKGRSRRNAGCKRRGGGKRGKGGKVRRQHKRKGGKRRGVSRRGKGGKVRRQSKCKGGKRRGVSRRGKGGKVRRQRKRKGGKRRRGGRRGKAGRVRTGSKQKRGGRGRGWGRRRGGHRRKGKGWGMGRRRGKRRGGGRSWSKRRGRRSWGLQ